MTHPAEVTDAQMPMLFKGIALLTPGGDLVYCIDPQKQNRWHLQLCIFLQELLALPEPPHFLVPCFTATVDRWQDPRTQMVHTFAEAYPPVMRHRSLLNLIFGCTDLDWQRAQQPDLCDPIVLAAYQQQFPQLWEPHELVARLESTHSAATVGLESRGGAIWSADQNLEVQGYVLRLFVAGSNSSTERILKNLHQILEEHLRQPYTLKVIDVHKHPEQAEADQITATPTLVRVLPQPVRRIVGELHNPATLLQILR